MHHWHRMTGLLWACRDPLGRFFLRSLRTLSEDQQDCTVRALPCGGRGFETHNLWEMGSYHVRLVLAAGLDYGCASHVSHQHQLQRATLDQRTSQQPT